MGKCKNCKVFISGSLDEEKLDESIGLTGYGIDLSLRKIKIASYFFNKEGV